MNTLVSLELEKLLLEKNIDTPVQVSISYVVMKLYKKYGIWIGVQPNEPFDDDWCFTIFKESKNNISLEGYNSPEQAYEEAIKHTLNNLI